MALKDLLNVTYAAIIEFKDADQRKAFDRDLEADPVAPGPDPNVLALMLMANTMPQQRPLAAAGNDWRPRESRNG